MTSADMYKQFECYVQSKLQKELAEAELWLTYAALTSLIAELRGHPWIGLWVVDEAGITGCLRTKVTIF